MYVCLYVCLYLVWMVGFSSGIGSVVDCKSVQSIKHVPLSLSVSLSLFDLFPAVLGSMDYSFPWPVPTGVIKIDGNSISCSCSVVVAFRRVAATAPVRVTPEATASNFSQWHEEE